MDPAQLRIYKQFYTHVMEAHSGESDPDEVLVEILAEQFIARDNVGYFNAGISIKSLVSYFNNQPKAQ